VGLVEGGILFDTKQYALAAERFSSLLTIGEKIKSVTLGYLYSALAAAKQERGDLRGAAPLFQEAMAQFEHFGLEIEKLRTAWSLALLSVQLGNSAAAIRQLSDTAAGFAARACLADSSLVTLDLVEQHLAAGHADEAAALCRTLPERFSAAGMKTSALTALEYLRDTAAAGRVTAREINYVRAFLHRLPAEPHLVFAPPPQ
jgi:tetratricopeptide (TPR) repeat protein